MTNESEDWLAILDDGLIRNPDMLVSLYDRAATLESLGRLEEAEAAFNAVLARDPKHYQTHISLTRFFASQKRFVEAYRCALATVEWHPRDAAAHSNLGYLLGLAEQNDEALAQYRHALALHPTDPLAHKGIALIYEKLGDETSAKHHLAQAEQTAGFSIAQYHGTGTPIPILLVLSAAEGRGSINFDYLIDDDIFQTVRLAIEDVDRELRLPPVRYIVNGIVDAERSPAALKRAQQMFENAGLPVINEFARVLATSRVENARRLAAVAGVRTPKMQLFTAADLQRAQRRTTLQAHGFDYPFLLRTPGLWSGRQFHYVSDEAELDATLAVMQGTKYIVLEYIDTRDEQGRYRKFRTLVIEGRLYPLHLALSTRWKVHYFSADMLESAENRAIEAAFLDDHAGFIGADAVAALTAIGTTLGLEYAGIDYGFDQDGRLVVFEANAGMSLVRPGPEPMWDYRRKAAEDAGAAALALLTNRAARPDGASRPDVAMTVEPCRTLPLDAS